MHQSRNLDMLRSCAVLCVLMRHVFPGVVPYAVGKYGVLVFFVHTALVLMMSMEREPGAIPFYIRRVFRIYPLSLSCVLVVLACQIPYSADGQSFTIPTAGRIIANMLLVQNFIPGHSSINAPLWSLPFEVQMYAVLPGAFYLIRRYGSQASAILSLLFCMIAISERLASPATVWITEYFPCFLGGIIAYTCRERLRILPAAAWPFYIGLLAVLYCGVGNLIEWPVCLALGAALPLFHEFPVGYTTRCAGLVAKYSYGIYLSHMPIIWLCLVKCQLSPASRWILLGVLLCSVPPFLYHCIEAPMIRAGKRLSHRCLPAVAPSGRSTQWETYPPVP